MDLYSSLGQDRGRGGRGKQAKHVVRSVAWKLIIYGHVSAVAAVAYKDSSWQLLRVPPVWPEGAKGKGEWGVASGRWVTGHAGHAICIMCSL